jgi:hypothetical protein
MAHGIKQEEVRIRIEPQTIASDLARRSIAFIEAL